MKYYSYKELINFLNSLDNNFEGYIQFSHRPINKEKDIFINKEIKIENEEGFIYEAHFCNGKKSISIKQINDKWIISEFDISNIDNNDIDEYETNIKNFNYKVKMAQIWQKEKDPLCENLEINRLKTIVFAGFEKGEDNDKSTL
jgi:CRISPR type III-associated protein (TIGR04423 family)